MRRERVSRNTVQAGWTPRAAVTACLMLALLLATTPWALAQTVMSDRHAEVIAQGVGEIPDGEAIWRVAGGEALPVADAEAAERATGFVFVPEGRTMVADTGTGQRAMLTDAEAAFQAAGTEQLRQSAGDDPVPYLSVDLIPFDAIDDRLAGDRLLMNAGQFAAPGGERDVNLVRDVLGDDELGELPGSDLPVFVYLTDGSLTVEDEADVPTDLEAGAGAMFSGALTLRAGPEGATYLAAVIGDEVAGVDGVSSGSSDTQTGDGAIRSGRSARPSASAEPAGETGLLRITFFNCGALVAPGAGPDECQPMSLLADDPRGAALASFSVLDAVNGTSVPVTGAPGRDGETYVWAAMPAGDYALVLGRDVLLDVLLAMSVSYGGDVPEGRAGDFSVMPDGSTDVEIRARVPSLVDPDSQPSPGLPSVTPVPSSSASPSPVASLLPLPSVIEELPAASAPPTSQPSPGIEIPIDALPPVFQPSLDPIIIPIIIPPVIEPPVTEP